MQAPKNLAKTVRLVTRTIRVLALIEAVDALFYLADSGWFAANPIVTALVAGGIVGAALTWVSHPPWVMGIGGLLVAIAPSALYAVSALLVVASLGLIALTRIRVRTGARRTGSAPGRS